MSKILNEVESICGNYITANQPNSLKIKNGKLDLEVYDNNNLLGFKLTGRAGGKSILIVHDSDNYDREKVEFNDLYSDVEKDIRHIAKAYVNNKITVNIVSEKRLFGKKQVLYVAIPNATGKLIEYQSLTVNTTNFFE